MGTWTKRCGPEAIKNVKCKIGPGLFAAKEVGSVIKIDCLSRDSMEDLVNVILVDAKVRYCSGNYQLGVLKDGRELKTKTAAECDISQSTLLEIRAKCLI